MRSPTSPPLSASSVAKALRAAARPDKIATYMSFFKTGPGQYAEGDRFIGVKAPDTRAAIKPFSQLPLKEVDKLLHSQWHEERLAALLILVAQFERGDTDRQRIIFDYYLANATRVNNWDLVDTTTPQIVGRWLYQQAKGWAVLRRLSRSENLWERRIAILATFYYTRQKQLAPVLEIAQRLLHDDHDLIHKAAGWMLREAGKRDVNVLEKFLDSHAPTMPRTMLRYAIEKFTTPRRKHYLGL